MNITKLTNDELCINHVSECVASEKCGAISLFVGTTRDHFDNKKVLKLEYEAYSSMAEKEMVKICNDAREKWKIENICIYHRLGVVAVKEASVIIAVSSEHRKESLEAVSFLIDSLKAKVPIWKKEIYEDGSQNWKENQECSWKNNDKKRKIDVEDGGNKKEKIFNIGDEINEEFSGKTKETLSLQEQNVSTNKETIILQELNKGILMSQELSVSMDKDREVAKNILDPNLVQIIASKTEVYKRINAFIAHKREEINILNVQEFCRLTNSLGVESTCARTSACLLRSKDSKGHFKLKKVVNEWGPQTINSETLSSNQFSQNDNKLLEENKQTKKEPSKFSTPYLSQPNKNEVPHGIEERLQNMETHLRIIPKDFSLSNIYARLREAENKLLYLESVSPEYPVYLKVKDSINKRKRLNNLQKDDNDFMGDLELEIYNLKMKLKNKQLQKKT